ncbi:hypothetical protein LguiB_012976 [Lonicera macranthoides]
MFKNRVYSQFVISVCNYKKTIVISVFPSLEIYSALINQKSNRINWGFPLSKFCRTCKIENFLIGSIGSCWMAKFLFDGIRLSVFRRRVINCIRFD